MTKYIYTYFWFSAKGDAGFSLCRRGWTQSHRWESPLSHWHALVRRTLACTQPRECDWWGLLGVGSCIHSMSSVWIIVVVFYSFYAVAPQVSFLLVIALYWTLYWTSLEKCYLNKIVIITHQLTLKLLLSAFRSTETWAPSTGCIPTVSSTPFSASVSTVIHIEHFTSKYVI